MGATNVGLAGCLCLGFTCSYVEKSVGAYSDGVGDGVQHWCLGGF